MSWIGETSERCSRQAAGSSPWCWSSKALYPMLWHARLEESLTSPLRTWQKTGDCSCVVVRLARLVMQNACVLLGGKEMDLESVKGWPHVLCKANPSSVSRPCLLKRSKTGEMISMKRLTLVLNETKRHVWLQHVV